MRNPQTDEIKMGEEFVTFYRDKKKVTTIKLSSACAADDCARCEGQLTIQGAVFLCEHCCHLVKRRDGVSEF
jgi:hypothetical protein